MHPSTAETTDGAFRVKWRHRAKHWIRDRRRDLRSRLSALLASRYGTPSPVGTPFREPPRTILICRVNKRLGNTLFVTPLVQSLAASFPGARIDVLVQDPAHRCLVTGLPGIREVIHVPRHPVRLARCLYHLRHRHYDLAIDPSVNAVSNRLALLLCRSRYKLGFAGPEQWVRLTHAVSVPADELHQARQAVHLLQNAAAPVSAPMARCLSVRPGETARAAAGRALARALGRNAPPAVATGSSRPAECNQGRGLVGFFVQATGRKRLPEQWWRQWARSVLADDHPPHLVQIVPPGSSPALRQDIPTISLEALDHLAALLGMLDVFVAADSGPMHLAAAAATRTIGLFRATDPRHYAPLGSNCMALEGDELNAERVADSTLRLLSAGAPTSARSTALAVERVHHNLTCTG